jgi:hypothetical protein
MSFGQDFLQGFFGVDGLKDYAHASKIFRTNQYELLPRYKFLFHVFFNINTGQIPALQKVFGSGDVATVGLVVKSAQLPSYTINVETMNQYNRKRLVQTKLDYNPVQIVFNDDQGDLIRNMWYNYMSYYYKDTANSYQGAAVTDGTIGQLASMQQGFSYNTRDTYTNSRPVNDWGYIGESYSDGLKNIGAGKEGGKPAFFRDITIYGLSQKKYASYTLINPMITEWQHDTYDYTAGGDIMTHTMNIRYETVKYGSGAVGGATPSNTVVGFGDPNRYDTVKSALARPGSTATVFGQGGLVDAVEGTFSDLAALASGRGGVQNILGAIQKAGTSYETFKGKDLKSLANTELRQYAQDAARQVLPAAVRVAMNSANGMVFPKAAGPAIGLNGQTTVQLPTPTQSLLNNQGR